MVPHSVVTVSLATAILPRLSAHARRRATSRPGPHPRRRDAHRARGRDPVRAAAAGHRARPRPRDLGLGRRPADDYALFAPSLAPVRLGLVFFTVHYLIAARLLRPRADPHGVLDPVRRRRRQHRRRGRCWSGRPTAEAHLAGAGARLHRGVRRGLAAVLPRAAPPARRPGHPAGWCGSWSGCSLAAAGSTAVALGVGAAARPASATTRASVVAAPARAGRDASSTWSSSSSWPGSLRLTRGDRRAGHGDAAPALRTTRMKRPTMTGTGVTDARPSAVR